MAERRNQQLTFSYDREGDILDIAIGQAKAAISKEVADDLYVRVDSKTKAIVGFMILNFIRRAQSGKVTSRLPITGEFELIKA